MDAGRTRIQPVFLFTLTQVNLLGRTDTRFPHDQMKVSLRGHEERPFAAKAEGPLWVDSSASIVTRRTAAQNHTGTLKHKIGEQEPCRDTPRVRSTCRGGKNRPKTNGTLICRMDGMDARCVRLPRLPAHHGADRAGVWGSDHRS